MPWLKKQRQGNHPVPRSSQRWVVLCSSPLTTMCSAMESLPRCSLGPGHDLARDGILCMDDEKIQRTTQNIGSWDGSDWCTLPHSLHHPTDGWRASTRLKVFCREYLSLSNCESSAGFAWLLLLSQPVRLCLLSNFPQGTLCRPQIWNPDSVPY